MGERAEDRDSRDHADDCQCAACRQEDQWQSLADVMPAVVAPLMRTEGKDDG